MEIPRIPIGNAIEVFIDFLIEYFSFATIAFTKIMDGVIRFIEGWLLVLPPWLFIIAAGSVVWWLSKKRGIAFFSIIGLLLIWSMGLWTATVSTITLVLIATITAIIVGLPIGIGAALSQTVYRVVWPILDVMQTMPAFVYLIPAIPFFGLGKVAAIFATVIFSMPPAIRLTCLGIRQVPKELVECADAFGSNRWQKLFKLQLPLATPTIMAGVNQTVMLALSMVVIAAMIGAGGLGGEVWRAIQRLRMGSGFEAGIGIVIIAIILDRVLQQVGAKKR